MTNGNEASARGMPNSDCTTGSATITDHMPTPPMVESSTVAARRSHACAESVIGVVACSLADSSNACMPMTCTEADTSVNHRHDVDHDDDSRSLNSAGSRR
jgi:hypothetical protein